MCISYRPSNLLCSHFQVLLTIMIMWGVCGLLTLSGYLPEGHPARTDVKLRIIQDSPWFRFPYPGQWGAPTVTAAGVLGMLAGVLACTVESISYYPTTARMCGKYSITVSTELCSLSCGPVNKSQNSIYSINFTRCASPI